MFCMLLSEGARVQTLQNCMNSYLCGGMTEEGRTRELEIKICKLEKVICKFLHVEDVDVHEMIQACESR